MSDKTYAETVGKAPFDWWHAIRNPSKYDHKALCKRAQFWTTCACGNQCAIIPRKKGITDFDKGFPLDRELALLGHTFYQAVSGMRWGSASIMLAQIEARSAILIEEELAKLNAAPI